jgi:hypothetical protein
MHANVERVVAVAFWLATFGFIAAAIADAFR